MALVASVYKASADRDFPDLLLLDEVDASLHPSMMRNMLDVIDRIFLKHRVKVILITHSPTTIALAPESAIHVMNRTGPSRLVKKSKSDALAILTEGFATIEQGLRLFDQVARSKLTIVTEGHNASILEKLLELHKMDGVQVLGGVENVSGDSQLRTIFQFLSRTQHSGKVLVVWDCDFKSSLQAQNNTFPFTIPSNPENSLARTGIENAFPEFLLESFIKTITFSNNKVIREFDDTQKKAFAAFIVSRANIDDFKYFSSLIEEINRINSL
jgi:hypothetical protein